MASKQIYRLFVGNIPWTVSKRELKECMSKFGFVKSTQVMFNRDTGMNRGFGFVEYSSKEGCESLLSQASIVLDGNKLNIHTDTEGNRYSRSFSHDNS